VNKEYSILIIEDEIEIANIIKTYLRIYAPFSKIVIAESTLQANQKITNQEFDLIVTDMQLGNRKAIDFIRRVKEHPKYYKIKFMVVSGCLTQEDTLSLMRMGIRNILVKPFTARQILINAFSCLRIEKKPQKTVDRILKKVKERFYKERDKFKNSVPDANLEKMIKNSKAQNKT